MVSSDDSTTPAEKSTKSSQSAKTDSHNGKEKRPKKIGRKILFSGVTTILALSLIELILIGVGVKL
jgi:hypothetical protein